MPTSFGKLDGSVARRCQPWFGPRSCHHIAAPITLSAERLGVGALGRPLSNAFILVCQAQRLGADASCIFHPRLKWCCPWTLFSTELKSSRLLSRLFIHANDGSSSVCLGKCRQPWPGWRRTATSACPLARYVNTEQKNHVVQRIAFLWCLILTDGGGVRGLSSLLILRRIMYNIQPSDNLHEIEKPCDYFDMICGTSTGGWVQSSHQPKLSFHRNAYTDGYYLVSLPSCWEDCVWGFRKLSKLI